MRQQLLFLKTLAVGFILLMGVTAKGATYFVKTNGSSAWANVSGGTVKELASGNAITAFTTINAAATGADTYYFAPGTYNINGVLPLTTGQIYGGFSGNETSISDLTTRLTSDLDGNGIVEPWELSNVVTFTITTFTYSNATGTANRTLSVTGTGGEVNGITFYDINYNTTGGNGAILLGEVSSAPSDGFNTAKAGKLTQCIVRQIKNSTAYGVVMITNANSVVDKCLIEDSRVIAGNGTIFMNKYGGTVSNSVIRNNIVSAYGGAIWMGATTGNSVDASANAIVSNCAIYNNTAGTNGGAIRAEALNSTGAKGIQIVNCTVVNNKTTTSSSASLELVNSGLIANTISLSDPYYEIRPTQATNYVINDVFGTNTGGTLYPSTGHNNTSGIADNTFTALNFKNPTAFQGAVGNSISDVATYTDALKSQIKNANYYITSTSSKAYTTYSTNYVSLPSSFKAAGGTGSSIAITATVPTTDINGTTRNTIGAYNYDGTAPTVAISSSLSSPTSTTPIPVTFTFSENVTGFTVGDVSVGNGTLSAITALSGKIFTATITPAGNGSVTVNIGGGVVKDGAGNDNTAASQFSITYAVAQTAPVGVTTTAVTGIGSGSATSGVSYTSDGGATIGNNGIMWYTTSTSNPDITSIPSNNKTINGSGELSGLTHNTVYYVRAYATNSVGTSYGSELSFTTKWAITASVGTADGTVSGGGDYANNATVTLAATATASGKRFMNWTASGNVVSISKSYTFTATSDKTVVANFSDVKATYYVRPTGSSAWGNIGASADQIITATDATNNFNLSYLANNLPDGTATYYFAAGTYAFIGVAGIGTQLTTGKIYGGFTGDESSIDMNARAISDLDLNGIIEPWELTNATVITGRSGFKYAEAGTTDGERLIRIDAGGEVNGVTLTDFKYGTYSGAISVGLAGTADDNDGKQGTLKRCIVRKIKSAIGVVQLTNSRSVVDQCLIEDCYGTTSYGAVYFNKFGGTLSNSVIRNNKATTYGGAIYAGNAAATTALKAVVKNCVIYNNTATTNGGAIRCDAASNAYSGIEVVNSTIANNTTSGVGVASVELINNGLLVNSIVVNDSKDEIRPNDVSNYVASVAYGTATGSALWPATNMASGKVYTDFSFVSPTTINGYVGIVGDAGFSQTDYNAVHAANFSINNVASVAVTTTAASSIPSTYLVGGSGASINTYSSVPTTDIAGLTRTGNITLGAYQATLDVANGSPVTISQNVNLAAVTVAPEAQLTLSIGKTLTVTDFTINSSSNGTGTYVDYGTTTVSGTATVNQNLSTYRSWYMSSPVANAKPTDNIDRIKYYTDAYNNSDKVNSWPTLYNSSLSTPVSYGTKFFETGKGYLVVPLSGNNIAFTGTLNTGEIPIALQKTDGTDKTGFNLIGNPYPSYLDWKAVYDYTTGSEVYPNRVVLVDGTMWYRTKVEVIPATNPVTYEYKYWTVNGLGVGSPTQASNSIPPMQAFWVRANTIGSTNLTINSTMRSHAPVENKMLKAPSAVNAALSLVRLQVSNGANTDEAVIYFSANASNERDVYDSPKMSNENVAIPEIYTTLGTEQLVINSMKTIPMDQEIGLGFVAGDATSFTLKANEVLNLPADVKLILKDNVTNAETDVTDGVTTYAFTPIATSGNRFSVIFRSAGAVTGLNSQNDNMLLVYTTQKNQITLVNNVVMTVGSTASVYNAVGQKLMSKQLTGSITLLNGNFTPGVYVVKVNNISMKVIVK